MKKITPKTIAVIAICALLVISFAIAFISMGVKSCNSKREEAEWLKSLEDITEEPFKEFTFPTTGLAAKLPAPKSNFGRIGRDSSDYFHLTVGNTSEEDYNEYVEKCMEKGFSVNYDKGSSYYIADDQEGYHLYLSFDKEENTMDITLEAPSKETQAPTQKPTEKPTEQATQAPATKAPETTGDSKSGVSSTTIREEIKEAIDSYETFVDEYCEFMKNYDSSDMSLLSEYLELLSKEAEMAEKFAAIEDQDLTEAEQAYYLEVSLRCTQKLQEAASAIA